MMHDDQDDVFVIRLDRLAMLFKPRRDMWYLKKYGLPFLYWNLMLKGRA